MKRSSPWVPSFARRGNEMAREAARWRVERCGSRQRTTSTSETDWVIEGSPRRLAQEHRDDREDEDSHGLVRARARVEESRRGRPAGEREAMRGASPESSFSHRSRRRGQYARATADGVGHCSQDAMTSLPCCWGTIHISNLAGSLATSRIEGTIRQPPENKIAAYLYAATSFPGGA